MDKRRAGREEEDRHGKEKKRRGNKVTFLVIYLEIITLTLVISNLLGLCELFEILQCLLTVPYPTSEVGMACNYL